MAKRVNQVSYKGILDMDQVTVTEITKESEDTYDLKAVLQTFDGKQVSITIKEEEPLPTVDME